MADNSRARKLNDKEIKVAPVIYWMSRDQRIHDNWALLFAQQIALELKQPLAVVFCLVPKFLQATKKHYDFMLKGLSELEAELKKYYIPLYLLKGEPVAKLPGFIKKYNAAALITDFSPLKISRKWKNQVKNKINTAFFEVDAHNVVPCWVASNKQEYSARTFRPKINKLLPKFLTEFPKIKKHKYKWPAPAPKIYWKNTNSKIWLQSGETEARKMLRYFIKHKLNKYFTARNDPGIDGLSNLSPYLHFGQISAQRITLEIKKSIASKRNKDAFLEELIVRRELSDNFCFYNRNYDSITGFPNWARQTLEKHKKDKRPYLYTRKQFEQAQTHDDLWNAAQQELLKHGKMHSYMRMYWAKKILEWSKTPSQALKFILYLNDKYELDGRDPNGYAGAAWSVGGVHDRPWPERKIFGKIRYMSYAGCERKFDVNKYINKTSTYHEKIN